MRITLFSHNYNYKLDKYNIGNPNSINRETTQYMISFPVK